MNISSSKRMNTTVYNTASKPKKFISLSEFNSPSNSLSPFYSIQRKKIKNSKHSRKNKIASLTPITSKFVDLVNQSKLEKKKHISYDRDYFFNLLKIHLKKNKRKDLSLNKPLPNVNSNTYNILNRTNVLRNVDREKDKEKNKNKTFIYRYNNKQKNKELYKRIDDEKKNLRIIYVNKFLSSNFNIDEKNKNNDNINNNIDNDNIKIKNKIEKKDYNFNKSKIRFMMYHGFNKKTKKNDNNSLGKHEVSKFKEMDGKYVRQLFLKNKIDNVNTQMKVVQKDVNVTKNKLYIFQYFK